MSWRNCCIARHIDASSDTLTLVIFDWFVLSMRMQVILDSLFAHPGSAPIGGGKKGEFRDWTSPGRIIVLGFLVRALPLSTRYKWVPANLMLGGNPTMDWYPIQGE